MNSSEEVMVDFIVTNLPKAEFVLFAWIAVVVAVFIDLAAGLYKAKSLGFLITSDGLKRSARKMVLYYSLMTFAGFMDIMIHGLEFVSIPYVSLFFGLFVLIIEGKSILERANEKERKRLIGGAKDVTAILASKDEIAKAIHEYLKDKADETK